jgi:hypothetical protein
VAIPATNDPVSNLSALLSTRGWELNTEFDPSGDPVWDFMASLPSVEQHGQEGYPTGIFIHMPEEPGFCTVEPATWSTQRNPYQRIYQRLNDLIAWLPQIETWRAPATTIHKSPLELAQMRAAGEITTGELLDSLNHFPFLPRNEFLQRPGGQGLAGAMVSGQYDELTPLLETGLLSPAEFEFLT